MRTSTLFLLAGLTGSLALSTSTSARADSPGGAHFYCDGTGIEKCTECLEPVGKPPGPLDDYEACVAAAEAKGLTLTCSAFSGGGGSYSHYFCPAGTSLSLKGGDGGGCAIAQGSGAFAGLALLAALGLAWDRRRRSRRAST